MIIGFLGCGNMGGAILAGVIEGEISSNDIIVANRSAEKNTALSEKHHVRTTMDVAELSSCKVVILGIKPQGLKSLKFEPEEGTIIVSLLAGTPIARLREKFPMARIVRTMPNLGQLAGNGMTGLLFDPDSGFESEDFELVENLFSAGGKVLVVDSEEKMDWVCAISGSGSGYFFLFAEYLAKSAVELGFTEKEAELLVRQTLLGAGEVADQFSEVSLAEWKKRVMSPGGTTEQAILTFDKAKLDVIVKRAVGAAVKRAKELSE